MLANRDYKPLIVPIFNSIAPRPSKQTGDDETMQRAKLLAAEAKSQVDRSEGLELALDGKKLETYRVESPLFETSGLVGRDALFPGLSGKRTAVSDGYWVILKPLPPGEHTLRVKARMKEVQGRVPFSLDVTYHLKVAP